MSTVSVAGIQTDIAWEDPPANFAQADRHLEAAVAAGAKLAVLPEMFATGFSMDAARMATHAPSIRSWLVEAARRHDVWLLAGLAEPGTERPRNAAVLYDPTGVERLRYHKIHPFSLAREHEHFEGGTEVPTTNACGLRLTALVCYDLRFPEVFRARADATDLFVVIANWPEPRRLHWSTLLRARAIEAQAYVLGVNRVGAGDRLEYVGDCALYDPFGAVVHRWVAGAEGVPGVLVGAVDPEAVRAARAKYSFLADRRPEVYETL